MFSLQSELLQPNVVRHYHGTDELQVLSPASEAAVCVLGSAAEPASHFLFLFRHLSSYTDQSGLVGTTCEGPEELQYVSDCNMALEQPYLTEQMVKDQYLAADYDMPADQHDPGYAYHDQEMQQGMQSGKQQVELPGYQQQEANYEGMWAESQSISYFEGKRHYKSGAYVGIYAQYSVMFCSTLHAIYLCRQRKYTHPVGVLLGCFNMVFVLLLSMLSVILQR